ncbi:very-long-chain aldehyde decarbonylase CER1-like [Andrographis paniculata]|uniref:very-long-chain aldehyde decarbonylase CER1-like n=1 Tax=Andrographis paniculata TaxID=175694 RepID=UPI0021E8D890|nr:very-long-chain aldehyde decarbonylase CER1-like [Andrographis paniculata]
MASKPGILTEWPWASLGTFKYAILAPWAIHAAYSYASATKDEKERELSYFLILPFLLSRILHNQIWISYSRYRTAKGANRILDKPIDFAQLDRENNWDDQIIFNGILFYLGYIYIEAAHRLPWWRMDGVVWTFLIHAGPVEFLYYWLHRALHHHFLYSRYHSHHHSSIVTEPITSVIHPFAEHIAYFALFSTPLLTTLHMGNASITSILVYLTYIDFMNNMGHCNFEHIPKQIFSIFPPLKYLVYTPSYHSLHHTQFRTNYSLFMPFYDYIYGTMDTSSDSLYENSLVRKLEVPDVVHLTHLMTPESIYHLRLGFAHLASRPLRSNWYLRLMWPVTLWSMALARVYGRVFAVERNVFEHLKLQIWAIPKYYVQYNMKWQKESINTLIEESILQADEEGVKVFSLGLLNQDEELNKNGELFVRNHPRLRVKLVDGSSLAVSIVLNAIPKRATEVAMLGSLSKTAYSIALTLCQGGTRVFTTSEDDFKKLKAKLSTDAAHNLVLSKQNSPKIWLVGSRVSEQEQLKASKGTTFIPFSQFPPKKLRKDCFYSCTPAMLAPKHLENIDSCENWLPRRAMSAPRIAGIVHAAEEWGVHECGDAMFDVEKIWQASLKHGFRPMENVVELSWESL